MKIDYVSLEIRFVRVFCLFIHLKACSANYDLQNVFGGFVCKTTIYVGHKCDNYLICFFGLLYVQRPINLI